MLGRITDASNATLLAEVELDGELRQCVYKPIAGERPLWDFPRGTLALREVAAHEISEAAGWHLVPPTVLRDGPHGVGSVQAWIEGSTGGGVLDLVDADAVPEGWLTVLKAETYDGSPVALAHADDPVLAGMAIFDAVTNNADRKVGHVLRANEQASEFTGELFGVDHGLTFNLDEKLRTVLWGWAGNRLPDRERERLEKLLDQLRPGSPLHELLDELLDVEEIDRTRHRVERLIRRGRFPRPAAGPYPAIPWPPL